MRKKILAKIENERQKISEDFGFNIVDNTYGDNTISIKLTTSRFLVENIFFGYFPKTIYYCSDDSQKMQIRYIAVLV